MSIRPRNTEGRQSHHGDIFRQADGDSVHVTSGDSSQRSGVGEGDTCSERTNKDGDDLLSLSPRDQQRKLEEVRMRIAEQEKCMLNHRQRLENNKEFYEHLYKMYVSETDEMAQKEAEIKKLKAEIEEFQREARELRIINRNVNYREAIEEQNLKDTTKYLRRFESQLKRIQMVTAKHEGIDDAIVVAYRKEREQLKEAQESAERLQKLRDNHKQNLEFVNEYLRTYFEEHGMVNGGEDLVPSDVLQKILLEKSAYSSHSHIDDHDDDDDIVFSTRMKYSEAPDNGTLSSDNNRSPSVSLNVPVKASQCTDVDRDTSPKMKCVLGSLNTKSTVLQHMHGEHVIKRNGEEHINALKTQKAKLRSRTREANDSVTSRQRATKASPARTQVHTTAVRTTKIIQKQAHKPPFDATQAKVKTVTLPEIVSRKNVCPTTSDISTRHNLSAVDGVQYSRCTAMSFSSTHTPAPPTALKQEKKRFSRKYKTNQS